MPRDALRDEREFRSLLQRRATINKPVHRIKKSKDFARLKGAPVRLHTHNFLILVEPTERDVSRLGVTVSTKIDKRAVVRNRIKRIIREAFRALRVQLAGYFDIVIIARKNASDCSSRDVERELSRALSQKGLLVKGSLQ